VSRRRLALVGLVEGEEDYAEHFGFGRWFAGPEFELTRALLDEHFHSLNGVEAALAGDLKERRVERVVDQVEDQTRFPFLGLKGQWMGVAVHPAGGGVDEDFEIGAGDLLASDGVDAGTRREFLRLGLLAAPDEDLRAFFREAVDGGPGCAAGSQDQDSGAFQSHALFEGTDDAGDIGIKAVELAVGAGADGVAGSELGGERVDVGEVGHDLLLEGHGDADSAQGKLTGEGEKVGDGFGLQGEIDRVDALAVEGAVLHQRRERVGDWVAGDAVDASCLVELFDAIEVPEGAGGDLAWGGFGSVVSGGEGEGRACAQAENAAYDAGLAHGDADDLGVAGAFGDPLQQFEAVGEGVSGADDFDEIRLEALDAVECNLGIDGFFEVVKADQEGSFALTERVELNGAAFFRGLDFEVDDGEASLGGMGQDVQLFGEGASESAAEGLAAAGGDGQDFFVRGEEFADGRYGCGGLFQGIQAKFKKLGVGASGFGSFQELVDCVSAQGYADSSYSGSKIGGRRDGRELRHKAIAAY